VPLPLVEQATASVLGIDGCFRLLVWPLPHMGTGSTASNLGIDGRLSSTDDMSSRPGRWAERCLWCVWVDSAEPTRRLLPLPLMESARRCVSDACRPWLSLDVMAVVEMELLVLPPLRLPRPWPRPPARLLPLPLMEPARWLLRLGRLLVDLVDGLPSSDAR
jgi:hypothetical protein